MSGIGTIYVYAPLAETIFFTPGKAHKRRGRMNPRLLDLFSGAGGAAVGYNRAGFDTIVGVDILPQKHYPFTFIQADALEYLAEHGREFDAIHASPPCQFYSRLRYLPWLRDKVYWRSIPPTREALQATGKPYVIENGWDAYWDMGTPAYICGASLGLALYRHRCFETWPFAVFQPGHPKHNRVITHGRASLGKRHHGLNGWDGVAGPPDGLLRHREVMGIDWMNGAELAQAIPPVYTEFIGKQLLAALGAGEQL